MDLNLKHFSWHITGLHGKRVKHPVTGEQQILFETRNGGEISLIHTTNCSGIDWLELAWIHNEVEIIGRFHCFLDVWLKLKEIAKKEVEK